MTELPLLNPQGGRTFIMMTLRYYVPVPRQGYGNTGPYQAVSRLAVNAAQARWSDLVYPYSRTHRLV